MDEKRYPMENRKVEMKEMIDLIPKMQEAVKKGLNRHYQKIRPDGKPHNHDGHVESELVGLRKAISMLDSKYILDIIFVLSHEEEKLYFNELKSYLDYVNVGTLSKRLKSLEKNEIIERKVYPNERPIRVSYNLTEMGHGVFRLLLPLLAYVAYYDQFKELKMNSKE